MYHFQAFYCGYTHFCKSADNPGALALAKTNVETWFAVVGIMEDFETSLKTMERLLPDIYEGVWDTYQEDMEARRK